MVDIGCLLFVYLNRKSAAPSILDVQSWTFDVRCSLVAFIDRNGRFRLLAAPLNPEP